jgi:hypothetical protein
VLSAAGTFTLGKDAVGIYLALELRQESLATRFCARSAVGRPRPRDVGSNSAPLRWRTHSQHHNSDADHSLNAAMLPDRCFRTLHDKAVGSRPRLPTAAAAECVITPTRRSYDGTLRWWLPLPVRGCTGMERFYRPLLCTP